jgi:hypothetical protein
MRLYSYVMSHDTGCAPRFERGLLVLSGCRDDICKKAQPGDYVMGIGRITLGYPEPVLVYIGRVKKRGNSTEPRLVFDKDESYYFGVKAPVIPDGLKYWRVPVRHRFNFSDNGMMVFRVVPTRKKFVDVKNHLVKDHVRHDAVNAKSRCRG